MKPRINVADLIMDWGGIEKFRVAMARQINEPLRRAAVAKWRERNSLPGWAVIALVDMHRANCEVGALHDYIMSEAPE